MSRHSLYLACFLLLPLLYFLSLPIAVGDLAVWVAHGAYFLRTGRVLRQDIFSVLPTSPLVYPWGITVVYALLDRLGGLVLVACFHKFVFLLYFFFLYRFSLHELRGKNRDIWTPRNLALVIICWIGLAILCVDRAALLAILPFLFAFRLLNQEAPLRWRQVGALSLLSMLWVNLHGSWILLPAMGAWRALFRTLHFRRWRSEEWAGCAGPALAAAINPFGFRVWNYVFATARISRARGMDEWLPTGLLHPYYPQGLWFYGLVVVAALELARGCWKKPKPLLQLSSPFCLLALLGPTAVRQTIWAFLALLPYARSRGLLTSARQSMRPAHLLRRSLNAALILLVAAATLLCLPPFKPLLYPLLPASKRMIFDGQAPFHIAAKIHAEGRRAPIFNEWIYGSFLLYALPNKIFIDTRNIPYGQEDFAAYTTVAKGEPGWEEILERYGVGLAVINSRMEPALLKAMLASASWRVEEREGESILLVKN